MHADGAGTKSASIHVLEETGDISVWNCQDALIMNIDDLLCVGTDNILLSSTIGRNKTNNCEVFQPLSMEPKS
jgi:phosphoribosylformylglycinamidine cyclo-ligase